jgi:hypothetical protein
MQWQLMNEYFHFVCLTKTRSARILSSVFLCLYDCASLIGNKVGDQLDATMMICW